LELYKRIFLSAVWRLSGSSDYRRRMEHLGTEEALLARSSDVSGLAQQQLTPFDRLTDDEVQRVECIYGMKPNPATIPAMEHEIGFSQWVEAVRSFQRLAREGRFRIMFFVNDAPPICGTEPGSDVFYDGGSKAVDEFYVRMLSDGTPVASSY